MALKKCKECGNKVSTKAKTCLSCGVPLKKNNGCLILIVLIVIIFFILSYYKSQVDKSKNRILQNNKEASQVNMQDSIKTKNELLKEYHRQGHFTGYTDPKNLEKDMIILSNQGSSKAKKVLDELLKCK